MGGGRFLFFPAGLVLRFEFLDSGAGLGETHGLVGGGGGGGHGGGLLVVQHHRCHGRSHRRQRLGRLQRRGRHHGQLNHEQTTGQYFEALVGGIFRGVGGGADRGGVRGLQRLRLLQPANLLRPHPTPSALSATKNGNSKGISCPGNGRRHTWRFSGGCSTGTGTGCRRREGADSATTATACD